jgi:hypothetical protein
MDNTFLVTEAGQPRFIPVHGPTVFRGLDGQALIEWVRHVARFAPVFPDQTFLEVVGRREVARLLT